MKTRLKAKRSPAGLDRMRRAAVAIGCVVDRGQGTMAANGSGAVLSVAPNGQRARIATSAHVVDTIETELQAGAEFAFCHFYGEMALEAPVPLLMARVLSWSVHPRWAESQDTAHDVAILEVEAKRIPAITFALARSVPPRGTEVALFGYPAPLARPCLRVTAGWFDSLGPDGQLRCLLGSLDGDSGGPVVNLATGELVGLCADGFEIPMGVGGIVGTNLAPASALLEVPEPGE